MVIKEWSIDLIVKKFTSIEQKFQLLDGKSEVSAIWERMRFPVYLQITEKIGVNTLPPKKIKESGLRLFGRVSMGFRLIWNSLFYNPFLTFRRPKYIFFGTPRRKKGPHDLYWDIYTDYLIDEIPLKDVLSIERPFRGGHLRPVKTKNIKYADFLSIMIRMLKKAGVAKDLFLNDSNFAKVEAEIESVFNVLIPVVHLANQSAQLRKIQVSLYKTLFRWLNPEMIFLVCSYGNENLVEAAKARKIKVVEIQHGLINPLQLGYSFPRPFKKNSFPDFLLSFGNYWPESTSLPINRKSIFSIGYPYLSMILEDFRDIQKKDQVVFLSQWINGLKIASCAVSLSVQKNRPKHIIYKLHPVEYSYWRSLYPDLLKAHNSGEIEVIEGDYPSLYQILAESSFQVGVYSMALFEGLAFQCRTIILKLNGYEYMRQIIDSKLATLIEEKANLDVFLAPQIKIDASLFFASNWKESFHKFLKNI